MLSMSPDQSHFIFNSRKQHLRVVLQLKVRSHPRLPSVSVLGLTPDEDLQDSDVTLTPMSYVYDEPQERI